MGFTISATDLFQRGNPQSEFPACAKPLRRRQANSEIESKDNCLFDGFDDFLRVIDHLEDFQI